MYKRVVAVIAMALFSLLALVAGIVTDLHDREFPQAIGAQTSLGLGFGDSQFTDREAFATLAQMDAGADLGLLKIAPDLARGGDERVFVAFDGRRLPPTFRWFNRSGVGRVVGSERLANSSPDGSYLITGDSARVADVETRLRSAGVRVTRTDASVTDSLRFAMGERGFQAAVVAAAALVVALALFWLAMRSRSRMLRVLAGSPTVRIQLQDLRGFAGVLLLSASVVSISGAAYIAVFRGRTYVDTFVEALVVLELTVITVSMLAALVLSALAWPSASALATRQPAIKSLRSAAVAVQCLTFLLLVGAAGPAWSAHRSAAATAAEMGQWRELADQVAIEFGMSEQEMIDIEPKVGRLVEDAEASDALAYSYTFTQQNWGGDLGGYSAVTLVNQKWLDLLVTDAPPDAFTAVSYDRVKDMLAREFGETLALLSRDNTPQGQILAGLDYRQPSSGFRLPVSEGGSGSLQFLDDVLVAVVPSVHAMINDRNLTSMMSTRNILFTGVSPTQALLQSSSLGVRALAEQGLAGDLNVVYVAEEGILRSQFLSYVLRLMTLALGALVIAFTVAATIGALISSLENARRDFPLRVGGHSWVPILQQRVVRQLLAGAALVGLLALLQQPEEIGALMTAASFGLLIVPFAHLCAARWTFASVTKRRA